MVSWILHRYLWMLIIRHRYSLLCLFSLYVVWSWKIFFQLEFHSYLAGFSTANLVVVIVLPVSTDYWMLGPSEIDHRRSIARLEGYPNPVRVELSLVFLFRFNNFPRMQNLMYGILTTRIVLNIREASRQGLQTELHTHNHSDSPACITPLRFIGQHKDGTDPSQSQAWEDPEINVQSHPDGQVSLV
jgi:hypothetical protein